MSKKNKVNDGKKKVNKRNNIFKKIFCVNGRFELIGLLKNLAIPLVGGIIISLITKDSMSTYGSLKKYNNTSCFCIFYSMDYFVYNDGPCSL